MYNPSLYYRCTIIHWTIHNQSNILKLGVHFICTRICDGLKARFLQFISIKMFSDAAWTSGQDCASQQEKSMVNTLYKQLFQTIFLADKYCHECYVKLAIIAALLPYKYLNI